MKNFRYHQGTALIILAIVLLGSSINCGTNNKKYHTNPNSYIVDQLANKKIIMLGDFRHGYPLPYKSLIFLLNKWFDKVKDGDSKIYDISLILEADTQEVARLNEFISSGNWTPFIKYWLPYNTMEWFEFCANLRSLKLKLDSLNAAHDLSNKISFDIFGAEAYNIFDNPQILGLSIKEGSKYFVNIRDSLSANNIIKYMGKYKNRKAIIFYGNLHLIKNYVNKNLAVSLPDSESYGYYLAHYLKEAFGEDYVLSINQWIVNRQMIENSPFSAAKDSNIFVYSKEIPWSNLKPKDFDGYILRHELTSPGHNLSYIFSKNIINADIKKMQFIKKYLPGYLAERYYNEAKESFKLLTGKNFDSLNQRQVRITINSFDGFSRLNSKGFRDYIFNEYFGNPADSKIRLLLWELGFGPGIMNTSMISKDEWDGIWKDVLPLIKYLNATGILWVGTPEEKKEADAFLSTYFQGPDSREEMKPQDYLRYYRRYYYKETY
jgi:hypothetical protein